MQESRARMLRRWLKFNAVGAMGFLLQALALEALAAGCRVNYLAATAMAVEMAVVHNFFWHEQFTWRDRADQRPSGRIKRLLAFHAATGSVSIGGNLALMAILVGWRHLPLLVGNVAAIVICAAVNFVVNDRVVFRERKVARGW